VEPAISADKNSFGAENGRKNQPKALDTHYLPPDQPKKLLDDWLELVTRLTLVDKYLKWFFPIFTSVAAKAEGDIGEITETHLHYLPNIGG